MTAYPIYAAGLIGIAGCLAIILMQKPSRGQMILQLLIFCIGITMLGRFFRAISTDADALIISKKLIYLGNSWIYFLIFLFFLFYFQIYVSRIVLISLSMLSVVMTLATITIDQNSLFYSSYSYQVIDGVLTEIKEYGILHTVYMLMVLSYCLVLLTIVLRQFQKSRQKRKRGPALLLIAILLPTSLHILTWAKIGFLAEYEPVALILSGLTLVYALATSDILDITELASHTVFSSIQDGLILTDNQFIFRDANETAFQIFAELSSFKGHRKSVESCETLRKILTGEDISDLLCIGHTYRPSVKSLKRDGDIYGYLIWLSDVTETITRESAQHLNEVRLRTIYEQIDDVVFEWDLEKNLICYSPLFEKRYGYSMNGSASQIFGDDMYIHPEDRKKIHAIHNSLMTECASCDVEYRIKQSVLGDTAYVWCRGRAKRVTDQAGKASLIVGTLTDINEEKKHLNALEAKVQCDSLTGLLNKRSVLMQMEQQLAQAVSGQTFAIAIIDIDDFRTINEQIGHLEADRILLEVANRIQSYCGSQDISGRFGGDEFVVLLVSFDSKMQLNETIQRLLACLNQPYHIQNAPISVTCSMGVSLYPTHGISVEELFRRADKALYDAKQNGKSCCSVFVQSAI